MIYCVSACDSTDEWRVCATQMDYGFSAARVRFCEPPKALSTKCVLAKRLPQIPPRPRARIGRAASRPKPKGEAGGLGYPIRRSTPVEANWPGRDSPTTTGIGCFPAWGNWWEIHALWTSFSCVSFDSPLFVIVSVYAEFYRNFPNISASQLS